MWLLMVNTTGAWAQARVVTPTYEANCQAPTWSPDGKKLAYEVNYHDKNTIDLYVYVPGQGTEQRVRPLNRGQTALTAGFQTKTGEMVAHEPSWAPGAIGRFVYAASNDGRDYDLYIDGASAVAKSPDADGGPSWSPKGRYIAFTSARTGQGDVYLLDVTAIDTPPRRLTQREDSSELYVAWSSNEQSLAYVSHSRSGDNIYVIDDIDDAKSRRLTFWSGTQTRPQWSPDGTHVAFYSNHIDDGQFDLYVTDLSGAEPHKLAEDVVMSHRGPAWTPDGQNIVFVQNDDANYDPIKLVPRDGSRTPRQVSSGTVGNADLDVVKGTDGKTYVAVAAQGLAGDKVRDFKRIFVFQLP